MMEYFHRLNILALLYLRPATLFHRINALPWYRETLQTWSDGLEYREGDSILEVGCATGELTKYLALRGALACGVDISPRMLRMARDSNTAGARFVQASALALPYEDRRFDYVVSASLINIVSDPPKAMREMARVCKPGGKVSLLVPVAGPADKSMSDLARALKLSGFSRAALMTWHRKAPKIDRQLLLEYFADANLHGMCCNTYLDGMVMTATGYLR